jgi:hypothetical protein
MVKDWEELQENLPCAVLAIKSAKWCKQNSSKELLSAVFIHLPHTQMSDQTKLYRCKTVINQG